MDRDASTISRSGSAQAHQDLLATLAALIQEVFVLMNEDLPATIAWFRTPARALDWTSPRDLLKMATLANRAQGCASSTRLNGAAVARRTRENSPFNHAGQIFKSVTLDF